MKCPECGNTRLLLQNAEVTCIDCGLVLEDALFGQESLTMIQEAYAEQPALATAGTRITGGSIVKKQWLYTSKEKSMQQASQKIELVGSKLKIPKHVLIEAELIYRSAAEKGLCVGRDGEQVIFATIYAACIIHQTPKIPREIIKNTTITKTRLLRTYRVIKKELELKMLSIKPLDLVERFGIRLKLQPETITKTEELIMQLEEKGITAGRKPETIVATALYITAKQQGEKITQRKVANALGIIELTIRKRMKEILIS